MILTNVEWHLLVEVINRKKILPVSGLKIFASLARANERVHRHNVRDFPQGKLDSEINARFLLNEHGDLHFLLNNFGVHIILFRLKN